MQEPKYSSKKPLLITGILLSVLLPLVAIGSNLLFKKLGFSFETQFYISRFTIWFSLLLLLLYSLKIEKQPLLIWKETEYPFSFFTIALFKTFLKLFLAVLATGLLMLLFKNPAESAILKKTLALFKSNFLLLFFTCVTAGITEELIFRGYLLPRLELLFKNRTLAIILSSILFGLLHFGYGTLFNIVGPIVIGLVFALQYEKYRNIKIVILCHFLWDLFLLLAKAR
ncbi:CPBP family intramembrane metalloprotease [Flavobacterium sp. GA093]|uniref:CPBP family intramembrane metalloprotease n=1 Tax=Flavobacterium hydrocarbonoxydans TaxID=2683249 RepID=A0A6I4NQQ6_9FLAO|nr:type II CAAX endopeptidase family protein [Flavobacterium hydrocarbonoxydans]MWB96431.1 CPBP family intramembrane metalloprotease [Flavobacterium hydrocarbonoxydans]